jgi:hypothetical protein
MIAAMSIWLLCTEAMRMNEILADYPDYSFTLFPSPLGV